MTKKSTTLSLCDRPHHWKEDPSDPIETFAEIIEAEDPHDSVESSAKKRHCSGEVHDAIAQFEDVSSSVISKSPLLRASAK